MLIKTRIQFCTIGKARAQIYGCVILSWCPRSSRDF